MSAWLVKRMRKGERITNLPREKAEAMCREASRLNRKGTIDSYIIRWKKDGKYVVERVF